MRIGHGYDAHRFSDEFITTTDIADVSLSVDEYPNVSKENDTAIIIGGVKIPHTHDLIAHSDGDVLIHALCDALLGALALGDIGKHFPDSSAEFKNIDSRILLRKVMQSVFDRQYEISNVDMTIIAQTPKMSPYIEAMCLCLADDLKIDLSQINIKATTTEKMGFTGRKEGIAAHVVVCIQTFLQDKV
ncbi:MAG: 2-C-methyl-D-erythritol 2,4-cyclodiphosphate synthase [gamma proteobacterium symbiont of Taylorina sp.]|nr:2-C-methyl-D-erythritol 2,4-cyclodiphosphate synthase [gamma proteobacterium symbiont of Taylorina sp.]